MKKIFVLLVIYAIYQNWADLTDTSIKTGYAKDNVVVMYSTDWCGYCKKARRFFNDNNIAFIEHDIEKSYDANERYQALGGQGIPLLQINGTLIAGFQQNKVIESLY